MRGCMRKEERMSEGMGKCANLVSEGNEKPINSVLEAEKDLECDVNDSADCGREVAATFL